MIVDTRALWDERQRLIEDIRQLADEVLGTADDALDRLKLPEQIGSAEETEALAARRGRPGDDGARPRGGAVAGAVRRGSASRPSRSGSAPSADQPEDAPPRRRAGHTVELEALPGGTEDATAARARLSGARSMAGP